MKLFLKNKFLISHIITFIISSIIVFLKFKHYYTPDAISYITVTEHILEGNFYSSINGYWSPLISWIMVPFLFVLKDGILSFQIINIIISALIVYKILKILKQYAINEFIIQLTIFCLCILVPLFGLLYLTSDILFTALLLQYFLMQAQNKIYNQPILLALIGVLLYLSKAFGIYFFIVHIILYFFVTNSKKANFKNVSKGLIIYLVLVSIWVAVLSVKYNEFTISTASKYNSKIVDIQHNIKHPCDTMLLIAPFENQKYTAWEEMWLHTKNNKTTNEKINVKRVKKNTLSSYQLFQKTPRYGIVIFAILLCIALYCKLKLQQLVLPFSLLIVFNIGYLLFFIEDRYLYFTILLLIIMTASLLNFIIIANKKLAIIFSTVFLYSTCRSAIDMYLTTNTIEENIIQNIKKEVDIDVNSNYATYNPYQLAGIAYENKWKNYSGIINYKTDSVLLLTDLTKYNIKYLILPDTFKLAQNIKLIYSNLNSKKISPFIIWKRN